MVRYGWLIEFYRRGLLRCNSGYRLRYRLDLIYGL